MSQYQTVLSHAYPALTLTNARAYNTTQAVYVAYLTPDCEIVNVYPIRLLTHQCPANVIARDARSQNQLCQVLVGLPAELLHIAITGRLLDDYPSAADPHMARLARMMLADNIDFPNCAVAYRAAVRFGDFIKPWWGMWKLDQDRTIIVDDPVYDETLDLPLVLATTPVPIFHSGE